MEETLRLQRADDRKNQVIVLGLFLAFGFFINRDIQIKGLYMDDLYLWSCYGEQSFREYVFPVGGTRFRFIFYLISYVVLGLVGTHITWIVPINIILNVLVAYTIYRFGKKLAGSGAAGFLAGIAYLLSRMSYYQIGQMYGLMETFALWAAVGILYCLFLYLNEDSHKAFFWANVLYFSICFIHERFMVLLPLFFLVLLMKGLLLKEREKAAAWICPAVNFAAVLAVRMVTIGTLSPAGTAGTDVADTFQLGQAVRFAISQVLYVFGVNDGPDHLNGLSFVNSPRPVHVLIFAAVAVTAVLTFLFLVTIWRDGRGRKRHLIHSLLFLTFIALCIGSSSVTIRVELRWVYVSYAAALLFLCYMVGAISGKSAVIHEHTKAFPGHTEARGNFCVALFALYVALLFPSELFYRSHYENLYLWPNQLRYNSLAEETYEKYGDEIFGKTIYIVGDSYEMSDFTARTFFKVYDRERRAEGLAVKIVDSSRDIGQVTEDMLVVAEDPAHHGFVDVTSFLRNEKCEIISGYYRDGWMDQHATIRVMTGKTGRIAFSCYYPGAIKGDETIHITAGSGVTETKDVAVTAETVEFEMKFPPYSSVELNFDTNFYVEDAKEQRGEDKMAMIVKIMTE